MSSRHPWEGAGVADRAVHVGGPPTRLASQEPRPISSVVLGSLLGLAWSTGLRGFMSEVAGAGTNVEWTGTFVWILLPGVVVGGLLGLADHRRRTGSIRGRRWLVMSPLLFAAIVFSHPTDILGIFEDGVGGGAIGVPLYGMAAGYALAGRGRPAGRVACGALALTAIPIWALTVTSFGGPQLALDRPRGLWVALYYWSFLAVLGLACAIPHRIDRPSPVTPAGGPLEGRSRVTNG
jgi:hypothetical protein